MNNSTRLDYYSYDDRVGTERRSSSGHLVIWSFGQMIGPDIVPFFLIDRNGDIDLHRGESWFTGKISVDLECPNTSLPAFVVKTIALLYKTFLYNILFIQNYKILKFII